MHFKHLDTEPLVMKGQRLCLRVRKSAFSESDHPRADDGRFGVKPGGHEATGKPHQEPGVDPADAPVSSAADIQGLNERDSDLAEELLSNGAKITTKGEVFVYHRTSKENAAKIKQTGKMTAKEDGIFFSTSESGQAEGFGDEVVRLKVPLSNLDLDDVFGEEAHVKIPLKRAGQILDVSDMMEAKPKAPKPTTSAPSDLQSSTDAIHARAATDPTLSYADIKAHVETLRPLPKPKLREIALSVHVHSTASSSKEWLLTQIENSIANRKGRSERTRTPDEKGLGYRVVKGSGGFLVRKSAGHFEESQHPRADDGRFGVVGGHGHVRFTEGTQGVAMKVTPEIRRVQLEIMESMGSAGMTSRHAQELDKLRQAGVGNEQADASAVAQDNAVESPKEEVAAQKPLTEGERRYHEIRAVQMGKEVTAIPRKIASVQNSKLGDKAKERKIAYLRQSAKLAQSQSEESMRILAADDAMKS